MSAREAGRDRQRPDAPESRRGDVVYRGYRYGEEEDVVALLNLAYPRDWGGMERWRAKHIDRPGFTPGEIHVAEYDGRIIGCLHTAVRPVRFEPGVTLMQSFDGDLGVDPGLRGLKLPEGLYRSSTDIHYEQEVVIRGGYATPPLWHRFYRPRIGYVSGFDTSRGFKKELSSEPVRRRLAARLGEAEGDAGEDAAAVVEIRVHGLDPIRVGLRSASGATVLGDNEAIEKPRLIVECDQRLFGLMSDQPGKGKLLATLLLTGTLRLRGLFSAGPRVMLWVLRNRGRLGKRGA